MGRLTRRVVAAFAAILLLAPSLTSPASAQTTLNLSGSTTTRPLIADLAYFYRREARKPPRFSIVGGGSAAGVADTARGIVDAGMTSRDLQAADPQGLVFTPIAYSGLCLASSPSNPVASLSRAQLQDIVAARTTSWAQLPGAPRTDAIVPVGYDLSAAAHGLFLSIFVDAATPLDYRPRVFPTAAQVRLFIQSTPAAVGYLDLAFTDGVHTVPFDGVPCTRQTIRSGAYPGRRPLGLMTRGRPRGEVARFLRWIARDATARRVIQTRYVAA